MRKSEAGFTILEALVVAGIGGLLAAVSFPSLSTAVNAHRLTAGLRETMYTIRAARSTAVVRNQQVRIVLTNSGNTLNIETSADGTNWTTLGQPQVLESGVTVSAISPTNGLKFAANGTVASPVTVTVRNARNGTGNVTVSLLGMVSVS